MIQGQKNSLLLLLVRNFHLWFLPLSIFVFYYPVLNFHFWPDDWQFVGPPAAMELLHKPLEIFTTLQVLHYAPLTRLWYCLLSVLFWEHPAPYHFVNLVLLSLTSIFFHRLLREYRFDPLPAIFGSAYFALTVSQTMMAGYIVGSNYYLLSMVFIFTFINWERYLAGGTKQHLVWTAVLVIGGQWVHTLAVILPFLLVARYYLTTRNERMVSTARLWANVGGMTAGAAAFVFFPRLIFSLLPELPNSAIMNFDPGQILMALWNCITKTILSGLWGGFGFPAPVPTSYLAQVLIMVLFFVWLVRRNHGHILTFSVILMFTAWIIPFALGGWYSYDFWARPRYMVIPNLGVGVIVASVASSCLINGKKWLRPYLTILISLFTILFLMLNWMNSREFLAGYGEQDQWVAQVAEKYRKNVEDVMKYLKCDPIYIIDVPINEAAGKTMKNGLLIQNLTHEFIHRFYFAPNANVIRRFVFLSDSSSKLQMEHRGCYVFAHGGVLSPP